MIEKIKTFPASIPLMHPHLRPRPPPQKPSFSFQNGVSFTQPAFYTDGGGNFLLFFHLERLEVVFPLSHLQFIFGRFKWHNGCSKTNKHIEIEKKNPNIISKGKFQQLWPFLFSQKCACMDMIFLSGIGPPIHNYGSVDGASTQAAQLRI